MRTRIAATLLCLLLAFSLAACVQADRTVVLNSDGSGVYTFTVGISDQLVRYPQCIGVDAGTVAVEDDVTISLDTGGQREH